ncbi:hypothetical protein D3C81_1441400 [compost metagenome]
MSLVRLRRDQRCACCAVAGNDALQQTKGDQHIHMGSEPHTSDNDRHSEASPEEHRFPPIFIGREPPNRGENRRDDKRNAKCESGITGYRIGLINPQLLDVERQNRSDLTHAYPCHEHAKPADDQISFPNRHNPKPSSFCKSSLSTARQLNILAE